MGADAIGGIEGAGGIGVRARMGAGMWRAVGASARSCTDAAAASVGEGALAAAATGTGSLDITPGTAATVLGAPGAAMPPLTSRRAGSVRSIGGVQALRERLERLPEVRRAANDVVPLLTAALLDETPAGAEIAAGRTSGVLALDIAPARPEHELLDEIGAARAKLGRRHPVRIETRTLRTPGERSRKHRRRGRARSPGPRPPWDRSGRWLSHRT
jgi:hypothetical protein